MSILSLIKFNRLKFRLKKRIKFISLGRNSIIEYDHNLIAQDYLYIGPGAYWSLKGGAMIGNNVIFGPKTVLWTYNHNYKSEMSIPYGGPDILKKVVIGDNTWIGFGTIILPGSQIGEGCIVAAGSVVSGVFPSNTLIGGNPAKSIKTLNVSEYNRLKSEDKLYLKLKYSEISEI